jgi:nucleoside-diphosphate-sugar epimerase
MNPRSLLGAGFIGSRYAALYPHDTIIEPRDSVIPTQADVLFGRSTTDNYAPLQGQFRKDADTNVGHLLDVLPNVRGRFAWLGTWFSYTPGISSQGKPARETDPCCPVGSYAISKVAAELYIQSHCATAAAGLIPGPASYQILRLCGVIGNDPRAGPRKNALEHMLTKLARDEDIEVYEGDCYRDILHVDDVCRAIRLIMERGAPDSIYNVGRGESTRMYDIMVYAKEQMESLSQIKRIPPPVFHRIVQTESFHMDTTKLRALGFQPALTIWESIDCVLANIPLNPAP